MQTKKRWMNKKTVLGLALTTMIALGFVTANVFIMTIDPDLRMWQTVRADGNPGAGASGMVKIAIYPHQADPAATYATNISEGTAYAHGNTWNGSLTGEVPYDTEFDIVVKARFNTTHAYNTTTSNWDIDYVKALITCAGLSIGADTEMTAVEVSENTTTYMWVQFYMNNAGSGYTVSHGVTTNVTSVKLQAYF